MEAPPDEALDPDLLAAVDNLDPIELLRRDLEDCLKEYSGIDLIVEILQNAIDAMDQRRYEAICQSAELQSDSEEVIEAWNRAVMNLIERDYEDYSDRDTAVQRGEYYENASDFETRREEWWEELGNEFDTEPDVLRTAANEYDPELTVRVRLGDSVWVEVEDSGTGIEDVEEVFKHKSSSKRVSRGSSKEKRLGVRGSHGWGLSAVLAMSDRVEVLTRSGDEAVEAYAFSNYSSFVSGDIASPSNERITIENGSPHLSSRLINDTDSRGTHIRIRLDDIEQDNQLGHTLLNYNHDKFENLLRMLTPIGQVNDYLLHPAFHVLRKGDLDINVETISEDLKTSTNIEFDIFRYSESSPGFASADFVTYLNSGWPSSTSVHTVHRTERGGDIYLVGAEIQDARELASEAESLLIDRNELSGKVKDDGEVEHSIQRGYHYAVSGGMKAEKLF
jgi:hypothetical protein